MQKLFENWRGFINEEQLSDSEFLQNIKSGDQVLRGKFQEEGIQLCSQVTKQSHPDRGDYTPSCSNEWSKIIDLDNFIKDFIGRYKDQGSRSGDVFGDLSKEEVFLKRQFKFTSFSDKDWEMYWLKVQHLDRHPNKQFEGLKILEKHLGKFHKLHKNLLFRIASNRKLIQPEGTINLDKLDRALAGLGVKWEDLYNKVMNTVQ